MEGFCVRARAIVHDYARERLALVADLTDPPSGQGSSDTPDRKRLSHAIRIACHCRETGAGGASFAAVILAGAKSLLCRNREEAGFPDGRCCVGPAETRDQGFRGADFLGVGGEPC